ncbi:MAG: 4-hydroxythreonine-4-phosphate dehydrogenase PdxA [Nitrospirota bacterium]
MNRIAITMGEPGGVGPEVIVKALSFPGIRECNPVIVGNAEVMKDAVRLTGLDLSVRSIPDLKHSMPEERTIDVIEIRSGLSSEKNIPSLEAGRAVVKYIRKAVSLALCGEAKAIVTAPISKESLRLAGYSWPGHTELLAELSGAEDVAMMFVSEKLRVILCTIHIALKDVAGNISEGRVYKTIKHTLAGARMLGINSPRIAVSGLNPHAGEAGIMGSEELDSIIPAIKIAQKTGMDVSGPYPPDVVFHRAYNGDFDMVVCMYHDQGLIPFKMLAFDTGVNATVGLPFIRTSPDHGTAFDIAWKNTASPSSMVEAIKLASKIKL